MQTIKRGSSKLKGHPNYSLRECGPLQPPFCRIPFRRISVLPNVTSYSPNNLKLVLTLNLGLSPRTFALSAALKKNRFGEKGFVETGFGETGIRLNWRTPRVWGPRDIAHRHILGQSGSGSVFVCTFYVIFLHNKLLLEIISSCN